MDVPEDCFIYKSHLSSDHHVFNPTYHLISMFLYLISYIFVAYTPALFLGLANNMNMWKLKGWTEWHQQHSFENNFSLWTLSVTDSNPVQIEERGREEKGSTHTLVLGFLCHKKENDSCSLWSDFQNESKNHVVILKWSMTQFANDCIFWPEMTQGLTLHQFWNLKLWLHGKVSC